MQDIPRYNCKNGRALVVAQCTYQRNIGLDPLPGCKTDGERIVAALDILGVQVTYKQDLEDVGEELMLFASACATATVDLVLVFFSGHGVSDRVYGVSGDLCVLSEFLGNFKVSKLKGVPKLFFFDCCRGHYEDRTATRNSRTTSQASSHALPRVLWVPNGADFLFAYSTVDNYVAHCVSQEDTSSLYSSRLAFWLVEGVKRKWQIETVLKRVAHDVSRRGIRAQCPEYRSTLTKTFVLREIDKEDDDNDDQSETSVGSGMSAWSVRDSDPAWSVRDSDSDLSDAELLGETRRQNLSTMGRMRGQLLQAIEEHDVDKFKEASNSIEFMLQHKDSETLVKERLAALGILTPSQPSAIKKNTKITSL